MLLVYYTFSCDILLCMEDKEVFLPRIGVGVMVWRGRQLLLGKRIVDGESACWQFPGGRLENEESVIECAVREVLEETGVQVKNLRHLGFTDTLFNLGNCTFIALLVSCEYEAGQARVLEPDKCSVWQWFDYRQLPAPLLKPIEVFLLQCDDLYSLHQSSVVLGACRI